jgi:phage terminase small subunit
MGRKKDVLTPKQAAFVREYMLDLNASKAAMRAGFSKKTACWIGQQLLAKPHVANAISDAQRKAADRAQVTQDDVVRELARVGFSNISNYLTFGQDGVVLKASSDIPPEAMCAVSEVSETRTKDGGSVRFKMHNKISALDSLCRILGFNAADRQNANNNTVPAELAKMLMEMIRLAGPNQ